MYSVIMYIKAEGNAAQARGGSGVLATPIAAQGETSPCPKKLKMNSPWIDKSSINLDRTWLSATL